MGLDLCLIVHCTESDYMFLHQGTNLQINSVDTALEELYLCCINNIEMHGCSIAIIHTKRTGTCTPNTPGVYEGHVYKILVTRNPKLFMIQTIQLKNEIESDHILVTFVNPSNIHYS